MVQWILITEVVGFWAMCNWYYITEVMAFWVIVW